MLETTLECIEGLRIVFLDEPTAGLDVEGRVAIHSEIRRLTAQNIFVLRIHFSNQIQVDKGYYVFKTTSLETIAILISSWKLNKIHVE